MRSRACGTAKYPSCTSPLAAAVHAGWRTTARARAFASRPTSAPAARSALAAGAVRLVPQVDPQAPRSCASASSFSSSPDGGAEPAPSARRRRAADAACRGAQRRRPASGSRRYASPPRHRRSAACRPSQARRLHLPAAKTAATAATSPAAAPRGARCGRESA